MNGTKEDFMSFDYAGYVNYVNFVYLWIYYIKLHVKNGT